jgi:hypothetical protein
MPFGLMSGAAFEALLPRDLLALLRHRPLELGDLPLRLDTSNYSE